MFRLEPTDKDGTTQTEADMAMHYSDETRETEEHTLPNIEVFYRTDAACRIDGWETGEGWYWWACMPGCLPDSEPLGPFATEAEALADARRF